METAIQSCGECKFIDSLKLQYLNKTVHFVCVNVDIIVHEKTLIFINLPELGMCKCCARKYGFRRLIFDSDYYILDGPEITIIESYPCEYTVSPINYKFIYLPELGNVIRFIDFSDDMVIYTLIYFDETCLPHTNEYVFQLGADKIIKPFDNECGNVVVMDNVGKTVPYKEIKITGERYEDEKMIIILNDLGAKFISKSGSNTKSARGLSY